MCRILYCIYFSAASCVVLDYEFKNHMQQTVTIYFLNKLIEAESDIANCYFLVHNLFVINIYIVSCLVSAKQETGLNCTDRMKIDVKLNISFL